MPESRGLGAALGFAKGTVGRCGSGHRRSTGSPCHKPRSLEGKPLLLGAPGRSRRVKGGGNARDSTLTLYHFTSARGRDSSHSKVAEPVSGMPISWGKRSIVTGGSAGTETKACAGGTKMHRLGDRKDQQDSITLCLVKAGHSLQPLPKFSVEGTHSPSFLTSCLHHSQPDPTVRCFALDTALQK